MDAFPAVTTGKSGWQSEFMVPYLNGLASEGRADRSAAANTAAEVGRLGTESTRSATELTRLGTESTRSATEQARLGAESTRAATEQTRLGAEANRVAAELLRLGAEANRQGLGDGLAAGMSSIPRTAAASANSIASGSLSLTFLTASKSFTAAQVRVPIGTAAASLTLSRFGLYSVAADGSLTLIGSSASAPGQFGTANSRVVIPLTAAVPITFGTRYAMGMLVVGTTPPQLANRAVAGGLTIPEAADDPRLTGVVQNLTDLPDTIAATGFTAVGTRQFYMTLMPASA